MDDIARELGISKKTIYQFFEDKNSLVNAVAELSILCDQKEIEAISALAKDPIDEVVRGSEFMRVSMAEMHPSVMYDLQKYHPSAWSIFQDYKNSYMINLIRKNLGQGIAQGLYRADMNPDIMARFRMEQVELGFNTDVFPVDRFNPIDVQIELIHHFLRGILTPKGYELYNQYFKPNAINSHHFLT